MTAWKRNPPRSCIPSPTYIRNVHNWTLHSSKTWDAHQSQVPQVQNSGTCPFFAAFFVWLTNPLAFLWSDNNVEPAIRIKHRYVTFLKHFLSRLLLVVWTEVTAEDSLQQGRELWSASYTCTSSSCMPLALIKYILACNIGLENSTLQGLLCYFHFLKFIPRYKCHH